jgi:hypothetical protein
MNLACEAGKADQAGTASGFQVTILHPKAQVTHAVIRWAGYPDGLMARCLQPLILPLCQCYPLVHVTTTGV